MSDSPSRVAPCVAATPSSQEGGRGAPPQASNHGDEGIAATTIVSRG